MRELRWSKPRVRGRSWEPQRAYTETCPLGKFTWEKLASTSRSALIMKPTQMKSAQGYKSQTVKPGLCLGLLSEVGGISVNTALRKMAQENVGPGSLLCSPSVALRPVGFVLPQLPPDSPSLDSSPGWLLWTVPRVHAANLLAPG